MIIRRNKSSAKFAEDFLTFCGAEKGKKIVTKRLQNG